MEVCRIKERLRYMGKEWRYRRLWDLHLRRGRHGLRCKLRDFTVDYERLDNVRYTPQVNESDNNQIYCTCRMTIEKLNRIHCR